MKRQNTIKNKKIQIRHHNPHITSLSHDFGLYSFKSKNALKASPSPQLKHPHQKQKKSTSKDKQKDKQNIPTVINININHHSKQNNNTLQQPNRKKINSIECKTQYRQKSNKKQPLTPHIQRKGLKQCQLAHNNPIPDAKYLIELNVNQDILCCQECSKKYPNTKLIPINTIGIQNLKTQSHKYYANIVREIKKLESFRINFVKYQQNIKSFIFQQINNHSLYYNSLIEIIRDAQKQSEQMLKKYINLMEDKLGNVRETLNSDILNLKQTFQLFMYLCKENKADYKVIGQHCQDALKKIKFKHQAMFEIDIIAFQIDDTLIDKFTTKFKQQFQITIYQKQLQYPPNIQKHNDSIFSLSQQTSRNQSKIINLQRQDLTRKNIDLFCDEDISQIKMKNPQKSKPMFFSFERNPDLIIAEQFDEDEVVVSPVFKQF